MMPNVMNCKVIYAENELREGFTPVLVHQAVVKDVKVVRFWKEEKTRTKNAAVEKWVANRGENWQELDTMPGNHGGVVNLDSGLSTQGGQDERFLGPHLVESQVYEFFQDRGVTFQRYQGRNPIVDLNRYGKLMLKLAPIRDLSTANYGFGATMSEDKAKLLTLGGKFGWLSEREVYEKTKRLVGSIDNRPTALLHTEEWTFTKSNLSDRFKHLKGKLRFFCNKDHYQLFAKQTGGLADVLNKLEQKVMFQESFKAEFIRMVRGFRARVMGREAWLHLQQYVINNAGVTEKQLRGY